jgi:hypothetical protein
MGPIEIIDPGAFYEADLQDGTQKCLHLGKTVMWYLVSNRWSQSMKST